MGNYKFKFSNMMPNAWFYKLKYMSKTKSQNSMKKPTKKKQKSKTKSPSPPSAAASPQQPDLCHQRKSYHFTRDLTANPPTPENNSVSHFSDPPRKSSKKRRSIKKNRAANRESPRQLVSSSSASADCSCRASLESVWTKPDSTPEDYPNYHLDSCSSANDDDSLFPELGSENGQDSFDDKVVSRSSSCHCRVKSNIICETTNNVKGEKLGEYDLVSHFELPPIITKTDKNEKSEATTEIRSFARVEERNLRIISNSSKEQRIINSPARKLLVNNSQGVKLRTNSPRIASKRFVQVYGRKSVSSGSSGGGSRRSLSESFAVVKSSQDPQRDFKESMCEMIMEYDIRTSKDLEDLLACYLSLNSDKYHGLIIKVFKQIWFEITDN